MPDASLEQIVEDWVNEHLKVPFVYKDSKIYYPCLDHLTALIRYATVDETIRLVRSNCSCVDCVRDEIRLGDPAAFDLLKRSLFSRANHKSAVVTYDVEPGDNIQHAIDHCTESGGTISLAEGVYNAEFLDLKDTNIIITGEAQFFNCEFNNIKHPITTNFDVLFNSCSFYASPDQQPKAALELKADYLLYGNSFTDTGMML